MDKLVLRARIEEIIGDLEPDEMGPDWRDDVIDELVSELTKLDLEEQFDITDEDGDDLDEG